MYSTLQSIDSIAISKSVSLNDYLQFQQFYRLIRKNHTGINDLQIKVIIKINYTRISSICNLNNRIIDIFDISFDFDRNVSRISISLGVHVVNNFFL